MAFVGGGLFSGHTADVIASRGALDEGVLFLQKPFSIERSVESVRQVLGQALGLPCRLPNVLDQTLAHPSGTAYAVRLKLHEVVRPSG